MTRRVVVRLVLLLGVGVLVLLCASFCVGRPSYYARKYQGPDTPPRFANARAVLVPEEQVELHTCGWHAVSSIYVAYGVDPEPLHVRYRLGTDTVLTNFDESSLGTIHPDIMRVMEQDGFEVSLVGNDLAPLKSHLEAGHPALALIRVRGLHWIAIDSIDGGEFVICDSLHSGLYREDAEVYSRGRIMSVLLVRPKRAP